MMFLAFAGQSLRVVVLPDPFREMGAQRDYAETQESGHPPKSGPEGKNRDWRSKDRFS